MNAATLFLIITVINKYNFTVKEEALYHSTGSQIAATAMYSAHSRYIDTKSLSQVDNMNSSAHLETLWTPFAINTNKRVTYCLLDNMSDGIECLSEEHVPTKTNKRKHDDLGPDSMFSEKQKGAPSPEEEEVDEMSNIRSNVLHKL